MFAKMSSFSSHMACTVSKVDSSKQPERSDVTVRAVIHCLALTGVGDLYQVPALPKVAFEQPTKY